VTKHISLSHTRVFEEVKRAEENAAKAERRAAAEAAKSAVKKINSQVEKTTLGDLTDLAELKAKLEAAQEK
jgi:small subunit ribosomal protein S1